MVPGSSSPGPQIPLAFQVERAVVCAERGHLVPPLCDWCVFCGVVPGDPLEVLWAASAAVPAGETTEGGEE